MSTSSEDDPSLAWAAGRRVVVGVSGGIAAYKVCTVVRGLREAGARVRVVPTEASLHFVGVATWEALSGEPVSTQVWEAVDEVAHVRLGQEADLVLVAPATADLIARAAQGLADDLLTNVLLTARGPVLMAPAMHTEMWQHPATRSNCETLRSRGVHLLEPASGRLTGADSGPGRLPEPEEILRAARHLLSPAKGADLAGVKVLISAGGTREPLDPVRYLGNRSSGRQGVALAEAARDRGALVTLVAAHLEVPAPWGIDVQPVSTALELGEAVERLSAGADVVVMAAAVADFRPETVEAFKIKKSADPDESPVLRLVRNPDVLAGLVVRRAAAAVKSSQGVGKEVGTGWTSPRRPMLIVGFAAETGTADHDPLALARDKLARKGCDLLVLNDVSAGAVFGSEVTHVFVLGAGGAVVAETHGSKREVAETLWDVMLKHGGNRLSENSS